MNYRIKFGVALLAVCLASNLFGEWADDEKLAQEALYPYVPTKEPALRNALLQEQASNVDSLAQQTPRRRKAATIVFNTGMSTTGIAELADSMQLNVTRVIINAPLNELGVIQTVGFGLDDLLATDGSLQQRLDYVVERARTLLLEHAHGVIDKKRAEDAFRVATGPLKIYSVEVVGETGSISRMARNEKVAGAFIQESDTRVREFDRRSRSSPRSS